MPWQIPAEGCRKAQNHAIGSKPVPPKFEVPVQIHASIHSFFQQIFTEHLICARYYQRHWSYSHAQIRQKFLTSCSQELQSGTPISLGDADNTQDNKVYNTLDSDKSWEEKNEMRKGE